MRDHNSHPYKTILGSSITSTNVKLFILCISVENDYEITAKQPVSLLQASFMQEQTSIFRGNAIITCQILLLPSIMENCRYRLNSHLAKNAIMNGVQLCSFNGRSIITNKLTIFHASLYLEVKFYIRAEYNQQKFLLLYSSRVNTTAYMPYNLNFIYINIYIRNNICSYCQHWKSNNHTNPFTTQDKIQCKLRVLLNIQFYQKELNIVEKALDTEILRCGRVQ